MTGRTLTVGTRGSQLALRQARWVADRLRASGTAAEVRVIKTTGDRTPAVPLGTLGPRAGIKGVFTKELEDALLDGGIDLAVHSLKDLPTELDARLALGCVPTRADPRDVLVGRRLANLDAGDRVGTGSPRRAAQLRDLRPGVQTVDLRGNVDTRLRKLRAGACEALLLAAAGLQRLGLAAEIAEALDPEQMVPAVGQGALGLEVRVGDRAVLAAITPLHDSAAAAETAAERALLRALGGGCAVPLGAWARAESGQLTLRAAAALGDRRLVRARGAAPLADAEELGAQVAAALRRTGFEAV